MERDPSARCETPPDAPPEEEAGQRPAPRTLERLRALFEVVVVSGFPTQLVLIVLLTGLGLGQTDEAGDLSRVFVYALLLTDALLVITLIGLFLHASRDRWGDVLLGSRPRLAEAGLGLATVPVVLVGVAVVMAGIRAAAPWLHNVPENPFESLVRTGQDALMMGAVAVLSGGIKEEIQRAFVLHRFGRYLGGERLGLVVFSVAFGAGHFMQGWDVGLITMLLGMSWGILYLWRRSIVASVASHSGFNVAQIVQFLVAGS